MNDATETSAAAMRPLRIGLATPAWPGTATANGIASATAQLAAGLESLGHEVTILAQRIDAPTDHPRVVELPDSPMSLVQRIMFRLTRDTVLRQRAIDPLIAGTRQAIRQHGIEVLMMEESFGWAAAVRKAVPIPVIATLHGPHWLHRTRPGKPGPGSDARRETWEAAGLQEIDGIISPSRDVLDRTRAEWGLPQVPTVVIGNPVRIDPLPRTAAEGPGQDLLFVGRFDRIKGADVLMQAFALIGKAHPTCRLTFIGPDSGIQQADGSNRHLAQVLADMPATVRDRITVLGHKTRDEIAAIRRNHPITLITSRYETFGVALIEAMAAGSAVISTRVGGCAEILRDGETGVLVPSENPAALASAVLGLLADPQRVRQLGNAARADVAARFSPENVAREVADFLAQFCRR